MGGRAGGEDEEVVCCADWEEERRPAPVVRDVDCLGRPKNEERAQAQKDTVEQVSGRR